MATFPDPPVGFRHGFNYQGGPEDGGKRYKDCGVMLSDDSEIVPALGRCPECIQEWDEHPGWLATEQPKTCEQALRRMERGT